MPTNIRLARASHRIERRLFLKALALGLTIPAAANLAKVATAAPAVATKRFLLLYMPHGVPPEHYNPQVSASDNTNFTLTQTNVSILGPLEPYKSYVNVYSGFNYPGQASTHEGIITCLSGTTFNTSDMSPRITVDGVIAKGLGVSPLILGACSHGPYGIDNHGMLFWDGTKAINPQKDPSAAADALFGSTTPMAAPTVNADVQLRSDLLALTATEIQNLQKEVTGLTREQSKLQTHLNAIQALQQGGNNSSNGAMSCKSRPSMPSVDMVRAASAGQVIDSSGGNDYFYQEKNFPLLFQAQLELVTQALICNAAQVIGLMPMYATCDFDFSFAGAPGSHHSMLSHSGSQSSPTAMYNSPISVFNYIASARTGFAKAQLWFCQQLVNKVVSVLATTDDPMAPGTKVLDNTLIYWMSEIGDGAGHTRDGEVEYPQVPSYLPLVTIGKCGGAIKSGQIVQYPLGTSTTPATTANRPAADIYLTMAQAMGVSSATFPGTTGVLKEVLA